MGSQAGLALMSQAVDWAIAGEDGTGGAASTGELAICAGWLALGAVMTGYWPAPTEPTH